MDDGIVPRSADLLAFGAKAALRVWRLTPSSTRAEPAHEISHPRQRQNDAGRLGHFGRAREVSGEQIPGIFRRIIEKVDCADAPAAIQIAARRVPAEPQRIRSVGTSEVGAHARTSSFPLSVAPPAIIRRSPVQPPSTDSIDGPNSPYGPLKHSDQPLAVTIAIGTLVWGPEGS